MGDILNIFVKKKVESLKHLPRFVGETSNPSVFTICVSSLISIATEKWEKQRKIVQITEYN